MGIEEITAQASVALPALLSNLCFQSVSLDWILSTIKLKTGRLTLPWIRGNPRYLPRLLANMIGESWDMSCLILRYTFLEHITLDLSILTFNPEASQKSVSTLVMICIWAVPTLANNRTSPAKKNVRYTWPSTRKVDRMPNLLWKFLRN